MMVKNNEERHRTAYAVTVDYKHGDYSLKAPFALLTTTRYYDWYLSARSLPDGSQTRPLLTA